LGETGALPAGVTFVDNGNGTATLSGTPTVMGTFNLTLIANDGLDAPVDQSFTLNVVAPASPAITSTAATTFTTGRRGSFTVTTTGIPFPAITDGSATLPSGVTFVDNKNGTATLSGTPAAGTGGVYDFTITANNGVGSPATQAFVLTVNERTAITNADSTIFVVGTAGSFTFTTTGYPSPTLSTVVGDLPTGVTFTNNGNGTATLAGTPALGAGGIYLLPITAANGIGGNATQNFVLTVDEAPSFTTANNATFTVSVSGSFEFITRGYPKATLTESGMLPFGLSFAAGTGTDTAFLSGIPALGQGGSYPITISASNGVGGVVSQSFTVNVQSSPNFSAARRRISPSAPPTASPFPPRPSPPPLSPNPARCPSGLSFHGQWQRHPHPFRSAADRRQGNLQVRHHRHQLTRLNQ
jgi:large repetitive protein